MYKISVKFRSIYLISGNSNPGIIAFKITVVLAWYVLLFLAPRFQKWDYKEFMIFLEYLLLIAGIGLIVFQSFGAISNLKIAAEQPSVDYVMPAEKAKLAYNWLYPIPYIIALIIAALVYFICCKRKIS